MQPARAQQEEGSQASQHHDDTRTRDPQAPVQRHTALCVEFLEVATRSNLGDAGVETVDTTQLAIAGDLALKLAGHGYLRYQPLKGLGLHIVVLCLNSVLRTCGSLDVCPGPLQVARVEFLQNPSFWLEPTSD